MAKSFLMIIGITGKIGSGKHTAVKILEERGFFLIDADQLAHDLYMRGSDIWHKLVDTFGKRIVGKNYEINRVKLGDIVFADSEKLDQLNAIIHPELRLSIQDNIAKATMQNKEDIVIVAALANQLGLKNLVEKIVIINAPIKERIKWLKKSRGLSEKEILKRNELQEDIEQFDLEIENIGDLSDLKEKISKIFL